MVPKLKSEKRGGEGDREASSSDWSPRVGLSERTSRFYFLQLCIERWISTARIPFLRRSGEHVDIYSAHKRSARRRC